MVSLGFFCALVLVCDALLGDQRALRVAQFRVVVPIVRNEAIRTVLSAIFK